MTITDDRCQNPKCEAFGAPLSEAWGHAWGDATPILVARWCDTCDFYEKRVVVSPSMGNEAWIDRKDWGRRAEQPYRPSSGIPEGRSETVGPGKVKMVAPWAFAIFVCFMVVMVVVLVVNTGKTEPRFDTVEVDGVRCIYDNGTDEIASCEWGPR